MNKSGKPGSRWKKSLAKAAVPVLLFGALWFKVHTARWYNEPKLRAVEKRARIAAGWAGLGAVNCGQWNTGDGSELLCHECAVNAFYAHKPFYFVEVSNQWKDNYATVTFGTRTGQIFTVTDREHDSKNSGSSIHYLSQEERETNLGIF